MFATSVDPAGGDAQQTGSVSTGVARAPGKHVMLECILIYLHWLHKLARLRRAGMRSTSKDTYLLQPKEDVNYALG